MPKLPVKPVPKYGTSLNISQANGEFLKVLCNGELVAELFGGQGRSRRDWETELEQARRLKALPKVLRAFAERLSKVHNREDHNHPKPDQKVMAYLMGFADGLLGIDNPHPANKDFEGLNLRMQRDYSPCFTEGFETGEAIRNIVEKLDA